MKDEADKILSSAMPAYEKALESLTTLNRNVKN